MTISIAIYGAGGLGRELLQVLRDMGTHCAGFVVDPDYAASDAVDGVAVHRSLQAMGKDPKVKFVIAIGNPSQRARIVQKVQHQIGTRFASIVHPRAWVSGNVTVGEGSMVFGLASITAGTVLGRHVLVNPGTTIAHDCILKDFATVGPSCALAGNVVVEEGAELGIGVRVAPRVHIGQGALVGAGAVCIRQALPFSTVIGVPARPLVRSK